MLTLIQFCFNNCKLIPEVACKLTNYYYYYCFCWNCSIYRVFWRNFFVFVPHNSFVILREWFACKKGARTNDFSERCKTCYCNFAFNISEHGYETYKRSVSRAFFLLALNKLEIIYSLFVCLIPSKAFKRYSNSAIVYM